MALAIHYEDLISKGHVRDYVEIGTLGHVMRAKGNTDDKSPFARLGPARAALECSPDRERA